jgi:hypothetical protein
MTKEVMMKTALKMMKIKSQKNQVMMRRRKGIERKRKRKKKLN